PVVGLPHVKFDEKGSANTEITLDTLTKGKEDGSFYLVTYPTCRSQWRQEKFKKIFPDAKDYRHSLAEETDCLSQLASSLSSTKKLRSDLKQLVDLQKQGMIESFVLLTMADDGIAEDYDAYRNGHRETLTTFIGTYMMH